MARGDPEDPLLHQVLPVKDETSDVPGYGADPVGDLDSLTCPGLLHKYHGRVLIITTAACGVHCRYCFRRHFPYNDNTPRGDEWQQAVQYIAADPSIREVILSGGDPLSLGNSRLYVMLEDLNKIAHLRRLRIHTRLPVIIPSRINQGLLQVLSGNPLQTVIVIHANHANELDENVHLAIGKLSDIGILILNQSVLLRGVNDSIQAQVDLAEGLFSTGVTPYYLHLLDKVRGAAHFDVSLHAARVIYEGMRRQLPGYLLPRLVTDNAGSTAKTPVI
jgi:EF-P beta-lysylation protein EpmB